MVFDFLVQHQKPHHVYKNEKRELAGPLFFCFLLILLLNHKEQVVYNRFNNTTNIMSIDLAD
ncbi:hypothetical protein BC343_08145 [Mucilaginibacter pedocola]|uniref:Uncharacterized protein n=1 Tax=Mucilaginibacter pedocola TaxID=1792845 RepID=A0A1S9PCB1_9SPHI|nr:hypothetical protein BC343_08145 [Mucilaginibacter pedocola]